MAMPIRNGTGILSRRSFLRAGVATGSAAFFTILTGSPAEAAIPATLTWGHVEEITRRQLATRRGYFPGDLLSQGDVRPVLEQLTQAGWHVTDKEALLKLVLDDNHFLVRELRTTAGTKFARGVAKQSLVFDRLDRLSSMPGGQQLIHDIIRLPNGQDLMRKKPTPGFTDLTSLLPKQANGKTPRDKDFNKPTGKIYAEAQLAKALEERWKLAKG